MCKFFFVLVLFFVSFALLVLYFDRINPPEEIDEQVWLDRHPHEGHDW